MLDLKPEATTIDPLTLDQLFLSARSFKSWRDQPVADETLHRLYDVAKWGPTSTNCSPARFVFVRSDEAKLRLLPCLDAGNVEKARTGPVTVIIATDRMFHEKLDRLFPHRDVRPKYRADVGYATETADRNSTLQGAYLMIAARALGLDVCPLSGFDRSKVDKTFLAGTDWTANFLAVLGYGDPAGLPPRPPRLSFDEACRLD